MPYKNESMLMGGDAAADTSTELCFNPPEGPFDASNVVKGNISHVGDEDWIAIKLTEGNTYTISVGGGDDGDDDTMNDLNDSVLKLMSGKGEEITMNDDIKPAEGMLGSEIEFTPEAGSGTQVYFISVSGYTGNPGAMNTGAYTVTVKEVAHPPAGEGVDIMGTDMDDKLTGTDDSESISGEDGNDSLFGLGGDDDLNGGDGNDLLVGGPGADKLTGGDAEGDTWGDTVTVQYDNPDPEADPEDAVLEETVPDIVNLTGSAMADNLAGDSRDNTIMGGSGDDKIYGGPGGGDDTLHGDGGDDTFYGGAGDDEMTAAAGDTDIFVFSPEDGDGDDIINSFEASGTTTTNRIDLRAFDLDPEDLIPLINIRGGSVRIDLRSVGGGTIELAGVNVLTGLDADGTLTAAGAIDGLSVWEDTDSDGMVESGENGIFIL